MFAHVCRKSGFHSRSRQSRLRIPSLRGRWNEQQPVCRWVTATEDCEVEARGRKTATFGLCCQRRTLPHVVPIRLARAPWKRSGHLRRLRNVCLWLFLHFPPPPSEWLRVSSVDKVTHEKERLIDLFRLSGIAILNGAPTCSVRKAAATVGTRLTLFTVILAYKSIVRAFWICLWSCYRLLCRWRPVTWSVGFSSKQLREHTSKLPYLLL